MVKNDAEKNEIDVPVDTFYLDDQKRKQFFKKNSAPLLHHLSPAPSIA